MHAKGTSVALGQHFEVAARLGGFDDAEGVLLTRNRQVFAIVASHLEKDSGARPSLVSLSRGVQESGTEPETGGDVFFGPDGMSDSSQHLLMRSIHLDVGEKG